jgi:hypothetical protein
MMSPIMKLSRAIFFPLLLAFALLFAQQAGATHALHHAFEDLTQHQEDKQAPHSNTCEQCAACAQLGSALNVGVYNFIPLLVPGESFQQSTVSLRSIKILAAAARGPPQLQKIA